MCSTLADRLAQIERAIDELAGESGTAPPAPAMWQMVADLDPELSRRMAGYRGTEDVPPGQA